MTAHGQLLIEDQLIMTSQMMTADEQLMKSSKKMTAQGHLLIEDQLMMTSQQLTAEEQLMKRSQQLPAQDQLLIEDQLPIDDDTLCNIVTDLEDTGKLALDAFIEEILLSQTDDLSV